ncbi:MAG TPA: alpha-L-fucosidase [Flavisolibacter sp.]|nr:alpha-L-fucosidase [Flavisolibacter sp.]
MKRSFLLLIAVCITYIAFAQEKPSAPTVYLSTIESLKTRTTPEWFGNAKFGIFIHWGLYSVPGWATPSGTPDKVTDWKHFYTNNPYAEWYLNTLRIKGSPTENYHNKKYGAGFDYYQFAKQFNAGVKSWNADNWAKLFKASGAKYVVLTTKHHEGFTLFPSTVTHPLVKKEVINSPRDLVKELEVAARRVGLKFGVYYSGGLDWSFTVSPITKIWPDLFESIPKSVAYTAYADMHLYEIIRRYKPDILWNDVSYPAHGDLPGIFAELFNTNPGAVVNNRWRQHDELANFTTPEYVVFDSIAKRKWESCRGIGYSFGYNRLEDEKQYLSADQLVDMLVDIVSKNGNFLLDVGPMADGTIPPMQASRILEMGEWLRVNGEAIYDTKPWVRPGAFTADSVAVRFTQKDNSLYAVLLDMPKTPEVKLTAVTIEKTSIIRLLGYDKNLAWKQEGKELIIQYPPGLPLKHAYTLKITPGPMAGK